MSHLFLTRLRHRLADNIWLLIYLVVLPLLVGARYFWIRGDIFPGEATFMPISILLWSALPLSIVALLASSAHSLIQKFGSLLKFLTILISIGLFVFEHYLLSSYKALYTDSIAVNILATNPDEASEFVSVIPLSYLAYPLLVALLLLAVCYYTLRRKPNHPVSKRVYLCYIIPLLLAIPAQWYFSTRARSYNFMAPIERIYFGTTESMNSSQAVSEMLAKLKDQDLGDISAPDLGKINVVLIMGESLRRDYMHCYGYPVNNTPRIDSMVATGEMILYTNATAPAPSTVDAVKGNISLYTRESSEPWYTYPTLMSLLSQAGYYTYWVSNQEKQGGYVMPVAAIAGTADSTKYIKVRTSSDWAAAYDEDIVPHLFHLNQVSKPLMQVVHLMGSHTAFPQRYPETYEIFQAKDLPELTPDGTPRRKGEKEDLNLAQYLNTIIYNDYVIDQIIKSLKDEPTLVVYPSDHGLEIHDDPTSPEHCGHTDQAIGLRIPLMFYSNEMLRQAHPDIWERIKQAKDKRIMNDLMATSISGLLGVQNKHVVDSLNFFSTTYNEGRKHTVSFYERVLELP